jgi:hypothetical protein
MDLRPTNGDEKLPVEPDDSPNFRLFFNGVPMGFRPTNDNENRRPRRIRAGSVSDLVWSFFASAPCLSRSGNEHL